MQDNQKQERGRKRQGASRKSIDDSTPSKAPRQETRELIGSGERTERSYARDSTQQGISNRPASEEHAFPASQPDAEEQSADTIVPQQQGGNKGQV